MTPRVATDLFRISLKANGRSPLTVKTYGYNLGQFVKFCEAESLTDVRDISSDHITRFIERFDIKSRQPTTTNSMKASINRLFAYLHAAGHVFRMPLALQYARVMRPVPPELIAKERMRIHKDVEGSPMLHLLTKLYLQKGLRLSEALALDVNDIASKDRVRVKGKGRKVREFEVTPDLIAPIDRWLSERETIVARAEARGKRYDRHALFLNQRGWRISARWIQMLFRSLFHKLGLKRMTPHGLRHVFANKLRAEGADLRVIQEALGHTHITTTQIYTPVNREDVSRALRKSAKIL